MQKSSENDITCVYYTANQISEHFLKNTQEKLLEALGGIPIVSVSHKPVSLGLNIIFDGKPSHVNIYRQALIGAAAAKTKYIAMAEDDILYSPEHFKYRSSPDTFAYNVGYWNLYTWNPSVFSYKGRRNMFGLICERNLFIEAMKERFDKYPEDEMIDPGIFAEPGKYEKNLGVTVRNSEEFYTNPCNIMFSHEKAISWSNLGSRKRVGNMRATEVDHWGRVEDVMDLYDSHT